VKYFCFSCTYSENRLLNSQNIVLIPLMTQFFQNYYIKINFVSVTKINRSMRFRETIAVCYENYMNHTNTYCSPHIEF
jgi:hypothetical protein